MKLRNFMYATMIACAFASCSNDDVPTPDNGNPTAGTYLTMRAQNPVSATKATGDPTVEDGIKSLTMVVIGADNTIEAIESTHEGVGGTLTRSTEVSAGSKTVLMVANIDLSTIEIGDSYSDIAALTCNRSEETAANGFSMNSKLYNVDVELNKTTFLGYDEMPANYTTANAILNTSATGGVKLYRNVAKVVLNEVTITNEKGDFTNYSNPNVVITDVFIMNANPTAMAVPTDGTKEWGSTQKTASSWLAGVAANTAWTNADLFKLASTWTDASYLVDNVADTEIGYHAEEGATMPTTTKAFASTPFYVYENGGEPLPTAAEKTLLVIKANVSYDTKDGRKTAENRYYTLAIGRTGFDGGFSTPGDDFPFANRSANGINGADAGKAYDVLRNLQYNISLTIKGMGYDQPGGGTPSQYLDVKVQVVEFGAVDQSVEI